MRIFNFHTCGRLSLLLVVSGCLSFARDSKLQLLEESRVSMACTFSIAAYSADSGGAFDAVNEAFGEIDRIDRLMSHYNPKSAISTLNRQASSGPTAVDPELFDFIQECVRYSRESDGAFDITVGPLMKAWGFFEGEGRFPSPLALKSACGRVGCRFLKLNAARRTIEFERGGMELDLGGIAKGYAVDRAVALLKKRGIESALVSAGGSTVYGLGHPPDCEGWPVGIRDPMGNKGNAETVLLCNRALSISGSSEKSFRRHGVTYSHVMDPRTGRPVRGILSVAVLADTGTAGDALDNIFYVLGPVKSKSYLSKVPGTEVIFFLPLGSRAWKSVRLKRKSL
ncbi:MAG TPA: FAD:protein FMN transferase [Acidobacteriota bacterium]|jgi:thiamine biosynthesis lipoprotein